MARLTRTGMGAHGTLRQTSLPLRMHRRQANSATHLQNFNDGETMEAFDDALRRKRGLTLR